MFQIHNVKHPTQSYMTSSETSPLLENGGHSGQGNLPFTRRVVNFMKGEDEPSWIESFNFFIFGTWFNILLVFIPLSFISHIMDWDAGLIFSFSFLAIVPLAKLLGEATDQLSVKLGETMSGLLNASFGNAVEIIVGVAALLDGQLRIVQMSMLGSILSNILLVLGCSFFAGGLYHKEGVFNGTGAQASASLMALSCITLVIPAAYASTTDAGMQNHCSDTSECPTAGLLFISRGTAILLLGVYCAYLWFQLKSHPKLFISPPSPTDEPNSEETVATTEMEETVPRMGTAAASVALLSVTVVIAFCAEYLVSSIEETAVRYSIPKPFIGVVLLPIVGNAAEHVTSVWMAMKNKYELTVTICVGSSIQIACFVVPLLVIVGWIVNQPLTLHFHNFETIVLFVSVFLVNLLMMDGRSNYMEGLMLLTLYVVIALAFWVTSVPSTVGDKAASNKLISAPPISLGAPQICTQ
ncbi:Sodium/calcium exchanger protein-domain-containing protein [Suillus subaureus]|uniref:Vacuolar calcium ion transporter n=1 Tax=Suillus subaureus TaxID=48587 RepID=A0A9P7ENW8_9AGAM|nr:Sodium/calcium exchanger protein-domain-containing protein [Suillus subaureus]KAG1826817.1 Sodium/calcium exchanger protein-domain-containing protein [Suillus subaureus]